MHHLRKSWLGLLVSGVAACGAPAELDESLFPAPGNTGYDRASGSLGGSSPLGSAGGSPFGGSGGSGAPSPGQGGSLNGGGGGSPGGAANLGGAGGSGADPVGAGGSESPLAGSGGELGSGGSEDPPGGGDCPDDITVLFARPGNQGGCDGGGCHNAGGTPPDLVSPNPEQRLLDMPSSAGCNSVPYISASGSLIEDKIVNNPPSCGSAMPFLTSQALTAEDRQCIVDWIAEVTGG